MSTTDKKSYGTLEQLQAAANAGELGNEQLVIDNDSCYLYLGEDPDDYCAFRCERWEWNEWAAKQTGIPTRDA